MQKKRTVVLGMLMTTVMLLLNVAVAAANKHSGTWVMNPSKSKYTLGAPTVNVTVKIEADDAHLKIDSQGTDAKGNTTHTKFEAKFDGKDYPATGLPVGDSVSAKLLNPNTTQVIMKKDGKPVMTVISRVSADGKTRTSTFSGKDAQGRPVHNVVVYDKK